MVVIPSPVELLSGETNSPSDCRAPIVTMRIAAAASVTTHALRKAAGGFSAVMPTLARNRHRRQFRSRHVAAVVAGEKHHGLCDLIGCAEPAERHNAVDQLASLLAHFRGS